MPAEWLRAGESRLRLHTIVRLRWLAVLGQSLTVVFVHWGLGMELPTGWCFAVIALSAWLNVALRIAYPASQRLSSRAAFLVLGYDIIQLAVLLYLTGGLENPFAFLLIAPVIVSASTLPLQVTVALGLLAIVVATILVPYHQMLPWPEGPHLRLHILYEIGVWVAVVLGIVFMGLYSWRTAEENRRMAEALAATEMVLAREQKLSALDGMAAAAAHGLGTPLATIAVATKELLREAKKTDPSYDDILLVRTQAERCRGILQELTARAEELDVIVSSMPVSHLIDELVEPCRALSVPITVTTRPQGGVLPGSPGANEPVTHRNPGVIYALSNLIENAIDFSKERVCVDATWSQDEVRIVITDDGEGFAPNVLEQLGEPFITSRPARDGGDSRPEATGMGLGFFIAKTLLGRACARLEVANKSEPATGAIVSVIWSRAAFESPQCCAEPEFLA